MTELPRNIEFSFVGAADVADDIEEMLALILKDYCKRFKVKVLKEPFYIGVAFVNLRDASEPGCTILTDDNRILVQVKDPYLDEEMKEPYTFINTKYMEIMCHEFVHVCQTLTGRKGIDLQISHNKKDKLEKYFFDPEEMEARLLESFYANVYAFPLLMENSNETSDIRY
jgi:hypothetical protein